MDCAEVLAQGMFITKTEAIHCPYKINGKCDPKKGCDHCGNK